MNTAAAASIAAVVRIQGATRHTRDGDAAGAVGATAEVVVSRSFPLRMYSISRRASPMSCRRCLGSLTRQRISSSRARAGMFAGTAAQSGSLLRTDAITSEWSSPSKARRPVSISYNTTPNAQTSARRSTALPRACSGAM